MNASDGHRLDQRGEVRHQSAHFASHARIFFHIGAHDRRVRAQPPRFEHGHRRFHPECARHITGREHHAALSPADNDGLIGERGVIALFDRRIEGVAIDMGDGQPVELGMPQQPR
jgi:hypothetical protein